MDYRREIDGLRAIAVIPVIFFHAGFETFSGGFVGVDIFFVISGYLITTIILAEKEAGSFSILSFYERRARRILPALFFVLAACLPAAWMWLLPEDMKSFSESLIAVPLFTSNLFFRNATGYFDTAAELKPLLHTWSLAVEEQYYLLFPILLILMWRLGRRWILAALGGLFVLSFATVVWWYAEKPSAAFYLLPTRGWELLTGAFVAFYLHRGNGFLPPHFREAGATLGLAMIVAGILLFDRETPFPSAYTLVPTLGAALIILFAKDDTHAGRFLGNRLFVGIGLISYSAYLWHQPIFAFAKHRLLDEPSKAVFAALSLMVIVLAYASWKYVEMPFRDKNRFSRPVIFTFGLLGSVAFVLLGRSGVSSEGFAFRTPSFADIASIKAVQHSRCHNNERRSPEQIANGDICTLGKGKAPSFAVIGDSHAGAIFESLDVLAAKKHLVFWAVSGSYCPPLKEFTLSYYQYDYCYESTKNAFEQIARSETIQFVVLVAEWANYTKGYRDDGDGIPKVVGLASDRNGAAPQPSENKIVFERSLVRTIDLLRQAGKKVVIVRSVPEFKRAVIPTAIKIRLYSENPKFLPEVSYADYQLRNQEVFEVFDRLSGVTFVDTKDFFCFNGTCRSVDENGRLMFSDTNHVTEFGASPIAKAVMGAISLW